MTDAPEPDVEALDEGPHDAGGPVIGPTERVVGLAALAAVLVAAGFGLQAVRGAASDAVSPAPAPAPTYTPVAIPDEARTTVYRSDVTATGEFAGASLTIDPVTAGESTNAYALQVETGTNIDPDAAARAVQAALDDPRGWAGFGRNDFRLVPFGSAPMAGATAQSDAAASGLAFVVTIASPTTADTLCGEDAATEGLWSCTVGQHIVLNSDRWHYMVPTFNNLDEYRAYLVNHQVGLFLGQAVGFCTTPGEPAPVMAEQEKDLAGCLPNAWPHLT
ncbi:DUF3152 domain-containing protein [Propioniciclava soli]|uniref:DUF3152 domain-containing protein n=1 Tax=Propioniciclava soli TaxID=2775081 RepID=A0ABZ3C945_9ACTN|nr:DUF3152 domain-containing protein [Propioniciclava soli]